MVFSFQPYSWFPIRAVTRIQEITKIIIDAVNNLSSSSGEILDFIDHQVMHDYDYLVSSSEQNSHNSFYINLGGDGNW